MPETFAENPPGCLQALADAGETCDPDSTRYALGHLQLRGEQGSIGATDGRQLLVQSGFMFPWEGDLLIPEAESSPARNSPGIQSVLVGQSGDWVAIRSGPWTVWLKINKDGRFPDLSRHIPPAADATARCQLSAADAEFLAEAIPKLPCDEEFNFPVTVDLNGSIAVRAKAADQAKPTEVVLNGSSWTGEPIRLNTNRKYLARALQARLPRTVRLRDQGARGLPGRRTGSTPGRCWTLNPPFPRPTTRSVSNRRRPDPIIPFPIPNRRRISTMSEPSPNLNEQRPRHHERHGRGQRQCGQAQRPGPQVQRAARPNGRTPRR